MDKRKLDLYVVDIEMDHLTGKVPSSSFMCLQHRGAPINLYEIEKDQSQSICLTSSENVTSSEALIVECLVSKIVKRNVVHIEIQNAVQKLPSLHDQKCCFTAEVYTVMKDLQMQVMKTQENDAEYVSPLDSVSYWDNCCHKLYRMNHNKNAKCGTILVSHSFAGRNSDIVSCLINHRRKETIPCGDICKDTGNMDSRNARYSCKCQKGDVSAEKNKSKSSTYVKCLACHGFGGEQGKWSRKVSVGKCVQTTFEQEVTSDDFIPGTREKERGVWAIPLEKRTTVDPVQPTDHGLSWPLVESASQLHADSSTSRIAVLKGLIDIHPQQVQPECPCQQSEVEHCTLALNEESDADFARAGFEDSDEKGKIECSVLECMQERKWSGSMSLKKDGDGNTEIIDTRVAHEAELDTAEDDLDDSSRRKEETMGDRFSTGQRLVHGASDLGMAAELKPFISPENAESERIVGSPKRELCFSGSVTDKVQPMHSRHNDMDTTEILPWPDDMLQFTEQATGEKNDLEDETPATNDLEDPTTVLEEGLQVISSCPGHMLQNLEQTASEESDLEEDGIPATKATQNPATVLVETDIVNLHPRTRKECMANLELLLLPRDQIPDAQISELSKVDDPSMTRRLQNASNVYHLYTQARRDLTALQEKVRLFFERNEVSEKVLQEYNCSAVKDLDKFIESVTAEWRSPFAEHLRDVIAMPVARVQLYRTAGLLKYASMRFHTFIDFPACERASPVRLAQTGFYYTGTDDLTQCFQCDKQHRNWTVMDIPHLIHCYLSPSCPVVMRNEPLTSDQGEQDLLSSMQAESGIALLVYLQMWRKKLTESNVTANSTMQAIRNMNRAGGGSGIVGQRLPALLPMSTRPALQTSTPLPQALPPAPIPLAVGGSRGQETGDALAREGSATGPGQFSRPHANKNYASYEQRFNSFRNWPATRTQRPDVLAHAGFFYAGAGDCVRCYHCGLGLKHWDDDDDPWLEHVRWRATCEHLIVTQGQAYVAQAFQEIVRRDREQEEIVQRFALNEEPRNVPRPRVSDNYQDISSGNRERTSQQTSPSTEPVPRPASQPAPQPTPQPPPQPTPQAAPQPAPQPAPQAAPQTVPPPVAAGTSQAAPVAKEQLQGASYNAGQLDDSPPASREGEDQAAGGDDEPTEGSAEDLSASERDRIQQLRQQNLALRQQNLCRECNKQEICMLFLPCQHLTMCEVCARNVKVCKTCKKKIKKKVKTFLS